MKRTRLSVCRRKIAYPSAEQALAAAVQGGWILRPYRCDRCGAHHLTSRRKGHHTPADVRVAVQSALLLRGGSSGTNEDTL